MCGDEHQMRPHISRGCSDGPLRWRLQSDGLQHGILHRVAAIDIVDDTFLVAPPEIVASAFADPATCRRLWPDLRLSVYGDRGAAGLRWTVRGALIGTMEIWLEPVLDGTVLHHYLRADPPAPLPARAAARERQRRQVAAKRIALDLKSVLEKGRSPGCPPTAP